MLHLQDDQIRHDDARTVNMVATRPEGKVKTIFDRAILRGVEDDHEYHPGLQAGIDDPEPELLQVKDEALHSNAVKDWIVHQNALFKLKIKERVPNIMKASETEVVDLVDPLLIHGLPGEDRVVSEEELHHDV